MAKPPGMSGQHIQESDDAAFDDEETLGSGPSKTAIDDFVHSGIDSEIQADSGLAAASSSFFGSDSASGIEIDPEAEEKVRASLAMLLDSLGHLSEEMLAAARIFLTQGDPNADPPSPGGLLVDMQVQLWWLARELGLDIKAELEKRLEAFNRVIDAHRRQAELIRLLQEQLALKEVPPPAAPSAEERCLIVMASGVNLRRNASEPPVWSWGFASFEDNAVNALAGKRYAKFRSDGASGTYVTITDEGRAACQKRFG